MEPKRLTALSRLAVLALAGCVTASAGAGDCPALGSGLLAHACHGPLGAEILLLPEDLADLDPAGEDRLIVTGVYTSAESREGGLPLPVGLFVRAGEVVSRRFAPMDGILLVERGRAQLFHRARVSLGGDRFNLNDELQRERFLALAERRGIDVVQSHLLIVDGVVDVRPQADAPRFRRRLLFVDAEGRLGLWQTSGSETLYDAAMALRAAHGAVMALNLDMGSFDLCLDAAPGMPLGEAESCGLLDWSDRMKLSNLLVLRPG